MHGLINRAVQCFVRDTYGRDRWHEVARKAGLGFTEFEAMLHYDDVLTEQVLDAIAAAVHIPRDVVLEDIGTYLVTHPNVEALRRLLRFSGVSFLEFLHSLDDLPARARLAVADLDLPELELRDRGNNTFSLICRHPHTGFGHVLIGILRTMADDYGALVLLEHTGNSDTVETIHIQLIEAAFGPGRSFDLGARSA
ncbi:MAG: heme NO-binding domain-containing protein [Cognatishimia sp.]|uniref:heme NO-binding domain-containing protein n=1 Tax=Cognatishimia sp. 1_MG-2023 TaxID=3062642 RepID=UPI0026E3F397|nr:heme NO-binding domain-containing protein [Cognatishimia sp. 1_MG-2023]MDO6726362.1 heme NO-binding domain-containing protein [Cognatishimia sp. 1_MG-2023]